jgi:hypothetical protein
MFRIGAVPAIVGAPQDGKLAALARPPLIKHHSRFSISSYAASIFPLQITVVGTGAGEAGFITNEFQIRDIEGKRRI